MQHNHNAGDPTLHTSPAFVVFNISVVNIVICCLHKENYEHFKIMTNINSMNYHVCIYTLSVFVKMKEQSKLIVCIGLGKLMKSIFEMLEHLLIKAKGLENV